MNSVAEDTIGETLPIWFINGPEGKVTAIVGVDDGDDTDGDLRNFQRYQFQVRDGRDATDQTTISTVSRTPAASPDAIDDLDTEPGIREVELSWDRASDDEHVTAWQMFYYSEETGSDNNIDEDAVTRCKGKQQRRHLYGM